MVEECVGSTPVLFDASMVLEQLDDIALHFVFEKPLYLQYNLMLDKNIKLFVDRVLNILSNALRPAVQHTVQEEHLKTSTHLLLEEECADTKDEEVVILQSSHSNHPSCSVVVENKDVETLGRPLFRITSVSLSTKHVSASLSFTTCVDDVAVNVEYQQLTCRTDLIYQPGTYCSHTRLHVVSKSDLASPLSEELCFFLICWSVQYYY